MTTQPPPGEPDDARPLGSVPTGTLLGQLFRKISDLLKKELELARAEVAADVRAAVARTIGMVAGILFAILGLGLFAAAAVLALAGVMPAWGAALVVGVAMFAIAGVLVAAARAKGMKKPLEKTQTTLKEDVRWAKERIA